MTSKEVLSLRAHEQGLARDSLAAVRSSLQHARDDGSRSPEVATRRIAYEVDQASWPKPNQKLHPLQQGIEIANHSSPISVPQPDLSRRRLGVRWRYTMSQTRSRHPAHFPPGTGQPQRQLDVLDLRKKVSPKRSNLSQCVRTDENAAPREEVALTQGSAPR